MWCQAIRRRTFYLTSGRKQLERAACFNRNGYAASPTVVLGDSAERGHPFRVSPRTACTSPSRSFQ